MFIKKGYLCPQSVLETVCASAAAGGWGMGGWTRSVVNKQHLQQQGEQQQQVGERTTIRRAATFGLFVAASLTGVACIACH